MDTHKPRLAWFVLKADLYILFKTNPVGLMNNKDIIST